jgi:hypothetical protein
MKKGKINFLVSVILVAVAVLIGFSFLLYAGEEIKKDTPNDICRESVKNNAALKFGGLDFSEDIACPAQRIEIEEDLSKDAGQKTAKKTIAEAMRDCWEIYGEGKLNLFSGEGTFCSVCSLISFAEPKTTELRGFTDYYYSEKIIGGTGKGLVYSQYTGGVYKGEMFKDQNSIAVDTEKDVLDTSQIYAVIFYYPKGEKHIGTFVNRMSMASPGLAVGTGTIALGGGAIAVGSALSATGIGASVGIPIIIIGATISVASSVIAEVFAEKQVEWAAFVFLKQYKKEEALAGCDYLPVKQADWWEET